MSKVKNDEVREILQELHERFGSWDKAGGVLGLNRSTTEAIGSGRVNPGKESWPKIRKHLLDVQIFLGRRVNKDKEEISLDEIMEYLDKTGKELKELEKDFARLWKRISKSKMEFSKIMKELSILAERATFLGVRLERIRSFETVGKLRQAFSSLKDILNGAKQI